MSAEKKLNKNTLPKKGRAVRPTVSAALDGGTLLETLYRPAENSTLFAVMQGGEISERRQYPFKNTTLVPYSPENNLIAHEVVLFPSEPTEYGTTAELVREIRYFIHAYVDVSPLFEEIASYYVLFSWVYDAFNELPYLRVRGDTGSGKTRCLLTIGSLCYKPIFASGASTVSPIFRILDSFRGTLIVDEGDFRFSDEKAEIIKILNNGNARGFPVLRSESLSNKEFDPRAFAVFGPKIIATRNHFEDRALETRCLTEETGSRRLRADIPLNLGEEAKRKSRELRNKLLMFRFRNLSKCRINPAFVDRSIEPRLAQLFGPLLSIIDDPAARQGLMNLAHDYNRDLVLERSTDTEAQVLEVIRDLIARPNHKSVSVKEITELFSDRYGDEMDRRVTPKWIGSIVRHNLQLKTYKSHGVFVLSPGETSKLPSLYEKFGVVDVEADIPSVEN